MPNLLKPSILLPVVLGFISTQAYALPHMPGIAHPPRIVKPGVPGFLPSGLRPGQVANAYGFSRFLSQGKGQTIAIIDAYDAPTIEHDLNVFARNYGLPACTTANGCFRKIYANGRRPKVDGDWAGETSLDVEWAYAMAPKAKIMLVEAKDSSMDALMQAVQVAVKKGATVVSMSWGGAEDASQLGVDPLFNNPLVTFVASSGDSGNGVSYPASSPYVISVGGTSLNVDPAGNYLGETAWSGSGGGISQYEVQPAFQANYPIPNNPDNRRGVPDVAYNADPNTGVSVYDSTPDSQGNKGWMVVGGTSAGAPQWAAFIAVANSSGKTLSNVSSLLYGTAAVNYANNFNDVSNGNNGDCGYYCSAQPGYDYTTGLGTPKVVSLASDLQRGLLG